MKVRLAAVRWLDAHGSETAEYQEYEVPHHGHEWVNYGIVLRDDDQGVSLAGAVDTEGVYRRVQFIPRALILAVVNLGCPRAGRKKAEPKVEA